MSQSQGASASVAFYVRVDGASRQNPCWSAETQLIGETLATLLKSGGGVCGGRTVHLRCPEGQHPVTVLFQPMTAPAASAES